MPVITGLLLLSKETVDGDQWGKWQKLCPQGDDGADKGLRLELVVWRGTQHAGCTGADTWLKKGRTLVPGWNGGPGCRDSNPDCLSLKSAIPPGTGSSPLLPPSLLCLSSSLQPYDLRGVQYLHLELSQAAALKKPPSSLGYSSHALPFTHLKCIIQWCLVDS